MTNPPVPATPLDVEACVRLLDDLIRMLSPHDAQSIAYANLLRALASALPSMGKDRERLNWMESAGHSLMYYGPGKWDVHASVQRTPRDAIDVVAAGECREIHPDLPGDGIVRCRRPLGHTGPHWGFDSPNTCIEWSARAVQPEECVTCGGSGEIEVSQTRSAKCVDCDGSGRRRAAQPEETSADAK